MLVHGVSRIEEIVGLEGHAHLGRLCDKKSKRELVGAGEHVCTAAAAMQQARDDEISRKLGVNN